ncbi:MAG: hypothetical protein GWP10_16845, partial [Nitrospiraceae bacterium]|nr:hypothetical protein [Nitrospiraceae bacterium]
VHLSSVIEEKSLSKLKDVFSDAIPLFYGSESEAKTFEDLYGIDLQEPKINLKVLHVYGGGFLNEFWGRASIEVIENALNAFKPKYYVISGQQISPLVSNIFKRHVEIYNPDIIGVRDYDSLKVCKNVNVPAEFSWDDGSDLILSLKKQLTQLNPPNSVYLHINLSNYVLSKSSFNEFIADITSVSGDKKSKFVLLNAYNRKSIAVKDTLKSIEYLGLEDIIPSFKVLDLVSSVFLHDSKPLMEMLRNSPPRFVLSNSYHVALTFSLWLSHLFISLKSFL